MKIINVNGFCMTPDGFIGLAEEGTFAAQAWIISDDAFNKMSGSKFSWTGPDGNSYVDDSSIFSRPTEEQIKNKMSPVVKEKAIERGFITVD